MAAGTILSRPLRHALLHMDADTWATVLASRPDLSDEPLMQHWAPRWPLIARRRAREDHAGRIPAGIPLPPALGKRRISFEVEPDLIGAVEPPPKLSAVLTVVPDVWRQTVEAVLGLGASARSDPSVFGSFAWAAMTGLDYISPYSDLDLIWTVTPDTDLDRLLGGLALIDAGAPGRLDGEVILGAEQMAVNWRELHRGGDEVLVKTMDAVSLRPTSWFLQARGS